MFVQVGKGFAQLLLLVICSVNNSSKAKLLRKKRQLDTDYNNYMFVEDLHHLDAELVESGSEYNNSSADIDVKPILNPLRYSGQCRTLNRLCQLCEGDCERDDHCAEGLACFIRNSKTPSQSLPVPGCGNNPKILFAKDFCYNMTLAPCGDLTSFFDNDSIEQSCEWLIEDEENKKHRCDLYGHYCRKTCGYCRTRTNL